MIGTNIVAGGSYRLRQNLEIRDDKTGTLKGYLAKGTIVKVRRIEAEEDHVFLEGQGAPTRLAALARMVEPA